jgi:DNA-binding NtrC family response regulator
MIYRHDDSTAGAAIVNLGEGQMPAQVLVVDDSSAIREVIVWMLHASGYRALAAENGLAAQRLLTDARPVLIISDLKMPLCDGWELLTYCHEHHPEIPVMLISGDGMGEHPEIERWAAGFMAKPFDSREFRTAVDQLISRAA